MSGKVRDLFTINRSDWLNVCSMGMNVACLYLVMARGTGEDNRTTSWSSHALVQRTGISKARARRAKELLINSGIPEVLKEGKHPQYRLPKQNEDELIWLPNTIVDGVNENAPPIEQVRQTGDVYCLQMCVDAYWSQNLVEDFGVSRGCFYRPYEREGLGEYGQYVIWGFIQDGPQSLFKNHPLVLAQQCKDDDFTEVWCRWNSLQDLSLIEYFPMLCESKSSDSEIIHPLVCPFDGDESLSEEARKAVIRAGLKPGLLADYDYVVPVLKHVRNVVLVDIASTKFKANSELTNSAYMTSKQLIEAYKEKYSGIDFYEENTKTAISR